MFLVRVLTGSASRNCHKDESRTVHSWQPMADTEKDKDNNLAQPLIKALETEREGSHSFDELPRQSSRYDRGTISFHPQRCRLLCVERDRRDVIVFFQFLVVFLTVGGYFLYQFLQYSNDKTNRKDYSFDESVDEMPLPFVYFDFPTSDYKKLNETNTFEDSDWQLSSYVLQNQTYYKYDNLMENISFYDDSVTMESILTLCETTDVAAYRYNGYWHQFLIIPSDKRNIKVHSKEAMSLNLIEYLNITDVITASTIFYIIDNKQQLNSYSTFGDLMNDFYEKSDYILTGYDVLFSYEWYSYDNKLDSLQMDEYDYFITTMESAFNVDDLYSSTFVNYVSVISIQPNAAGKKTTFVTEQAVDIYEILSLTGGMFTVIHSLIAMFTVYLIWGFDFTFIKFNGVAANAHPSQIERRKLKSYLSRYVKESISNELAARDDEIRELRQMIFQLQQNNQTGYNSNDTAMF